MGKASKDKGKRGERELAKALREYGYDTKRAQQYAGGTESADVIGLDYIHIECKRYSQVTEGMKKEFIAQATRDSEGSNNIPVTMYKEDYGKWNVVMKYSDFAEMMANLVKINLYQYLNEILIITTTLEDWIKLYREYELTRKATGI